ncbi:Hypothetical predicted protein [Cloeon dipterum]|uniref:SEFIR domain-containing protein n=4 Tax=Cloeon dipterum TaxID=197152 RepID=A0A8S1CDR4_9INSE|nr:Hypothetical predicted protein [Cloeon dipterum]
MKLCYNLGTSLAFLFSALAAQNDLFRGGNKVETVTVSKHDSCFQVVQKYNASELEISENGTRKIFLQWPTHVRCDLGYAEAIIYFNEHAKTPSVCSSSARSEFYPYLLRNYLIQEYSSGRNDSEDMTFIVAKQGCFFAEIVFTNYSTSERTIFTSRPVFVHTQVPKDKSINLRSLVSSDDKLYLDMILLMVAVGVVILCVAYRASCRLYKFIFKGSEEEERLPAILTLVKQNTIKRQKSLKVLLLYARQEEELMNLVQELREHLQRSLACEVVDIYHKDYEHRLNAFGFEFVEDFLHSDSCFNVHHEVKIVMIHTDWGLKIYEAHMTKCKIQYKEPKYIDSYYNEALKILIQAENVDYQKIYHIGFEDYPLKKPLSRPKFNCNPMYYYPKEFELFVQAIKRRPDEKIQEESTNDDLQIAETPC